MLRVGSYLRLAVIALAICGLVAAGCGPSASRPIETPTTTEATTSEASTPATRATSAPRATTVGTDQPTPAAPSRVRAQVLSVTDGDTIRVSLDGRSVAIRYIGIDTPETVDPRTSVECFGREATAFNRRLVEGKTVELEKDVSELDRFGRTLRYVWVERGTEMVMVNEELVREGFATASTYPPDVRYQDRLGRLAATARAAALGLWGPVCAVASPLPLSSPVATTAPTAVPLTVAPVTRAPTTAPRTLAPTARTNCHPSYPTVCIPPAPPDLDCGQIQYRRFTVLPPDPHRFDGDRDGIGCE